MRDIYKLLRLLLYALAAGVRAPRRRVPLQRQGRSWCREERERDPGPHGGRDGPHQAARLGRRELK